MAAHTLNELSRYNSNPLYFILLTRDHKMSTFDYFSNSRIAPHTHLSQIHSHVTLYRFISTSKFFISIAKITNTGECQSIYLRITHTIFYCKNLKRDSLKISPPKFSCYLCTLFLSNCKFEITTVSQIYYRIIS